MGAAFLSQLEHAKSPSAEAALTFYLAATLLHEYTHYGHTAKSTHFPGEEGPAFEHEVFGVDVTEQNAGVLMLNFTLTR